jgi:hypothetical protein
LFLIFDLIFAPGKFSWQQNKVLEKFFPTFFFSPAKENRRKMSKLASPSSFSRKEEN